MNRLAVFLAGMALLVALLPGSAKAEKLRPISQNWEVAAPGANVDAITDVTWATDNTLRLTIQLDTGSVVNLMVSNGGTENALGLNANTALTAGAVYVFDVPGIPTSSTVNVQVETDSAIPMLSICEVRQQ